MPASSRPAPPSGEPPPEAATLSDGATVALAPLAEEVCARYRAEFPDEQARYGDAGVAWCVHDNRWILSWAFGSVDPGYVDFDAHVAWLAGVLGARDFPLERLARDLEIAADVVRERGVPQAEAIARRLVAPAAELRER